MSNEESIRRKRRQIRECEQAIECLNSSHSVYKNRERDLESQVRKLKGFEDVRKNDAFEGEMADNFERILENTVCNARGLIVCCDHFTEEVNEQIRLLRKKISSLRSEIASLMD